MNIQFSESLFFLPWIGPDYFNSKKSEKVLVLGESIYCCTPYSCKNPLCKNQIKDIVTKQIEVKEKNRFYTSIAKLCTKNKPFNLKEKINFWNSVAFYEFVQVSVGTKRQQRPSEAMWNDAAKPFTELVSKIEADIIYATGKELTNNLIRNFETILIYKSTSTFFEFRIVRFSEKWIKLISFYHPAYYKGFNYSIKEQLLEFTEAPIQNYL